jgi:sarcosine oxidase subunit beta
MIPIFKDLRIIRQWTGICDKTPDFKPIVGSLQDGLFITCGHYDYGINLTPIIGKLLAEYIHTGKSDPILNSFDPKRFN